MITVTLGQVKSVAYPTRRLEERRRYYCVDNLTCSLSIKAFIDIQANISERFLPVPLKLDARQSQ